MFEKIVGTLRLGHARKGRKRSTTGTPSRFRQLRHEFLEERRVLATLTVNVASDSAAAVDNGSLTLREAISAVNGTYTPTAVSGDKVQIDQSIHPLGENDVIQFAPSVYGQTITITGASLVVSKRVTITGPAGTSNRITIQKGGSSSATVGLRFQSFNLAPNNVLPADTGVFNLGISGFGTGIEVASLSSTNFNFELSLKIVGNEITNNETGIRINNSNIPFKIEGNRIIGTSPTAGLGISLTNSDQTVVNLPLPDDYKPTIGKDVVNGGNVTSLARSPALVDRGTSYGLQREPTTSAKLPGNLLQYPPPVYDRLLFLRTSSTEVTHETAFIRSPFLGSRVVAQQRRGWHPV